ncbi:hypothetical protein KJ836_01975 [Patescibacteria group bacterium]|nr:hypothetical protein [Patescibacteria group bacterium]
MELFTTPILSSYLIAATVLFFITSAITVFDTRLTQAKRRGDIPANEQELPKWVGVFYWLHWIIGAAIILLNWKYAIIVFVAKFILSVAPVLEVIGNILMSPLRRR